MATHLYWTLLYQILVFAATVYLMGLAVVQLATGRHRLDFETHVLCTGVGLAVFTVSVIALNVLGIPLTWWAFLALGCGLFILCTLRDVFFKRARKDAPEKPPFWTRKDLYLAGAFLLAGSLLAVFLCGSFASDWLTDDDSWIHATSAKYVSMHHTYTIDVPTRQYMADFKPENRPTQPIHSYLEPYPPSYAVLMGVLHQINHPQNSMMSTLNIFNAVIISMGIVYFYLMVKAFTRRPLLALLMTAMLWVMPCFMSHFIWAQSLALVLFFPAFYALERSRREPRWAIVAAVLVGGVLLAQPSSAAIFALLAGIYWFVNALWVALGMEDHEGSGRSLIRQALAGIGGMAIAAAYYVPTPMKFGWSLFYYGVARGRAHSPGLKVAGVGGRNYYGFGDFFFSRASNKINQPIGIGPVLFLVAVAGIVVMALRWRRLKDSRIQVITLAWLVFGVLGTLANYFPIALFPHRFWAFMAIPVAMVAGEFLYFLAKRLSIAEVLLSQTLAVSLAAGLIVMGVGFIVYVCIPNPELPRPAITTTRLLAMIAAALTAFASCLGLIFYFVGRKVGPMRIVCSGWLMLLSTGILFTSGYPKLYHEGIVSWSDGIWFYKTNVEARNKQGEVVKNENGRPIMLRCANDLRGYMRIRHKFPANTPMLPLSLNDDHLIGFDMWCPPLDLELMAFRRRLQGLTLDQITEQTAREIYVKARPRFRFVVVDHYWAAWCNRRVVKNVRKIHRLINGIGKDRFDAIHRGLSSPSPAEQVALDDFQATDRKLNEWHLKEMQARERVQRLMAVMVRSKLFKLRRPFYYLGANVFEVVPQPTPEQLGPVTPN